MSNRDKKISPLNIILTAIIWGAGYGCAPIITYHGHEVDGKKLNALRPQVSTKENTVQLLGSPSSTSLNPNRLWLYMSQENRAWLPTFETEANRRVTAIYFNADGTVRKKETLTLANGRDIKFVPEITPPPIGNVNWIERLFKNIGRVTPVGVPSSSSP